MNEKGVQLGGESSTLFLGSRRVGVGVGGTAEHYPSALCLGQSSVGSKGFGAALGARVSGFFVGPLASLCSFFAARRVPVAAGV